MSYEIDVLRALFRLARKRTHASHEDLLVRVGGDLRDVRRALTVLARAGLVHRTVDGPRLTLAGLAVAASCAAPVGAGVKKKRKPAATVQALPRARVLPMVRRHRAA